MAEMKSRWFRFSLRTLLLLIAVLCVWLGIQVNAAHRQKAAVEAILRAGGSVGYTYQLRPDGTFRSPYPEFSLFYIDRNAPTPGPAWLRKLIGDDYFRTAVQVQIPITDEDAAKAAINAMARLPTIRGVSLVAFKRDCKIQDRDLAPLGRLNKLQRLSLRDLEVSGEFFSQLSNPGGIIQLQVMGVPLDIDDAAMAHIGKMTNLENLVLLNCNRVTDAGLAHLCKLSRLRELSLQYFGSITDAGLKHLARLNQLTYVVVAHSQVTADGIRELQKSLPTCHITAPNPR